MEESWKKRMKHLCLCNRLRAALDCDKKFKGNETS